MTHDELVTLMSTLGTLVSPGLGTEDAPVTILYGEVEQAKPEAVETKAWTTESTDGAQILVVEMPLGSKLTAIFDVDLFSTWAAAFNPRSLFGTIDVERHGETGRSTVVITVRHALPTTCISPEGAGVVLAGMHRTRTRCAREFLRLAHLRRREQLDDAYFSRRSAIRAELDALVGLQPVKTMISQLSAQQRIARLRDRAGMKTVTPSPHLVFTGNPGTGKTTVAKLIGRLYHELGLLSKGHVVEVDRSGLVAGYLGQTALKTREACEAAAGGVLFVDEAYALVGSDRDYGHEAVETLLTCMEARRGDFAVIVAGYPAPMGEFLVSNPGLASRFDLTLHFPDYSDDELLRIFDALVREHDYSVDPPVRRLVRDYIAAMPRQVGFGNAREIRRLFNEIVCAHADLLRRVPHPSTEQLRVIPPSAVPAAERSVDHTLDRVVTTAADSANRLLAAGYL